MQHAKLLYKTLTLVLCMLVYLMYVIVIVNRMSQIGSHASSSLDHVHYPAYEVSLCKFLPPCVMVVLII